MLRYKDEILKMYGRKVKQVNKIAAKNAYERGKYPIFFVEVN